MQTTRLQAPARGAAAPESPGAGGGSWRVNPQACGQAAAGPPFPLGTVLPPTGLSDTGQQGGAEGRGAIPDPKQLLTFTAYSLPALRPRYTFPKAPRLMGFTMVNSSIDGGRGTSMRLGPAAAGTTSPRSCSSGRGSAAGSTIPMSHPAPPPRADSKRRPPRPAPRRHRPTAARGGGARRSREILRAAAVGPCHGGRRRRLAVLVRLPTVPRARWRAARPPALPGGAEALHPEHTRRYWRRRRWALRGGGCRRARPGFSAVWYLVSGAVLLTTS